jgi:UDP-glucuronate 4-epimerase
MSVLVTGAAGFIGFQVARRLLATGFEVVGLDGFVPYYDPALKVRREALLCRQAGFTSIPLMLEDGEGLKRVLARHRPEIVVHLAAQAGVRYSLDHPQSYISSNIVGTFNLLEACKSHPPRHLLLASTSSAYGANTAIPFRETDKAVHPLTIYAATKISTELIAHCYAHLWGLPTTLFRFFTVYGPWGRPDMAYWIFTQKILAGEAIELFDHGRAARDFTYVDDLVDSIVELMDVTPPLPAARAGMAAIEGDTLSPVAPQRVVNIGRGSPEPVTALVDAIEKALGRSAIRRLKPLPPGDVPQTFASADLLVALTGRRPATTLDEGIKAFVDWYLDDARASRDAC